MGNNCPTAEYRSWKNVPKNVKKAMDELLVMKANSINRLKKKLLHRSGSRRFSYRGSKFPEIDMFKEVYVRPGDELTEQLHSTMVEKGQTVLEEMASRLPLETPIEEVFPPEDAECFPLRLHGNVHRGPRKAILHDSSASSSGQRTEEVQMLTSEVAGLKEQIVARQFQIAAQNNLMNQIHRPLQISGIHFLNIEPPPETTSLPPATSAIVTSMTTFFSFVLNCFQI
ncbi:hypothetical protein D8674_017312 [Pyrus ussuriensis x Pyrus communis]|uniref:Uncharacterized protein n=1 Tax=Pyrus ussuriensis x Pyrus communis TaxID=2448454 RepID=A0A5N5HHS2_9ROSA|nr:hypothetical protein D8674_017312 [Pyrus ussuriensis x Pyrus communis]